MNRPTLALAALLALPAAAAAQTFPTTPPALGAAPAVNPPVPVQRTLANGMKVLYVRQPELPVVSAALVIRGAGTTQDPAAVPGLASFTASMLDEGAAGKSALQIADALDLLGASLQAGAGWDAASVNLYVLKKNFAPALGLMADVVLRPVAGMPHYVTCVRYNPRDTANRYEGEHTNLVVFLGGNIAQFLPGNPESCSGLTFQRYPEIEALVP